MKDSHESLHVYPFRGSEMHKLRPENQGNDPEVSPFAHAELDFRYLMVRVEVG